MEKILLAGSTGYLGIFIAKELQQRSCFMRAIARSPKKLDQNDIEDEADRWASDVLIPATQWSDLRLSPRSTASVVAFAEELRIHPAIPAGRIRREQKNYRLFTKLIGNGTVRRSFLSAS